MMKKTINILDELSLTESMSSDRPGAVTQLLSDPRPATGPLHSAVPHCIAQVSQEKKIMFRTSSRMLIRITKDNQNPQDCDQDPFAHSQEEGWQSVEPTKMEHFWPRFNPFPKLAGRLVNGCGSHTRFV